MEFFDSHAHYNNEKFDNDRKTILSNLYKVENITRIVCAGYNIEKSKYALEIANENSFLFATVRNITK